MRKRILAVVITVVSCLSLMMSVAASDDVHVVVNGEAVIFSKAPVMIDDRLLVPIRTVAEAMDCEIGWDAEIQGVKISNEIVSLTLRIDHADMKIANDAGESTVLMDVAPILIDDTTYLPLRTVAEALGGVVTWENGVTYINDARREAEMQVTYAEPEYQPSKDGEHTFYFQNEARFNLPVNGSGYCWVCSYAMVLSDVMGYAITPVDVAAVNSAQGANGNYCYHAQIVEAFGAKFIPALDSSSVYYKGYEPYFGITYLNTPDEQSAINALKEALDRNPAGVMVRFEAVSPHTIVATGYEGNTIYFNEPMPYGYGYSESSIYEHVPFDQTHPGGYCGLGLKDMDFIQAIAAK